MALPIPKVEIGFDITGADAPLFTLDSPSKGVLDNTLYKLSGTIFYDVTSLAKSVTIQRGKNRQLDEYDAGLANVVFINNDRTFDPEYANSPFYGQVIPKRAIRLSSGGQVLFTGVIDDWNLAYDPSGYSEASAAASDAFTLFNTQTLTAGTAIYEYSGERIERILDSADVNWPTQNRIIETGQTVLGENVISENTNALTYMRTIAKSEPGDLFMDRLGNVVFRDRNTTSTGTPLLFSDNGEGISYTSMKVVYGSELLYNQIILTNYADIQVAVEDLQSIQEYGILTLNQSGLFTESSDDLANIAVLLAARYSQPEYRFEAIELILDKFDFATQEQLLSLELGDIVQIEFTPNKIPPAIIKYAEVIRIDHTISTGMHIMSLGFGAIDGSPWTLSDTVFGRLFAGNILGF